MTLCPENMFREPRMYCGNLEKEMIPSKKKLNEECETGAPVLGRMHRIKEPGLWTTQRCEVIPE